MIPTIPFMGRVLPFKPSQGIDSIGPYHGMEFDLGTEDKAIAFLEEILSGLIDRSAEVPREHPAYPDFRLYSASLIPGTGLVRARFRIPCITVESGR